MNKSIPRDIFIEGIKIIVKYLKPYKRTLVFLSLFGLLNAAAQAFTPLVAGKIFDAIIGISRNYLAPLMPAFSLTGIWLILQITGNATSWWTDFNNDKLKTFLGSEYISKGFGKLLEMPLSFHIAQKHGEIGDKINRASIWMEKIAGNVILTLLPNFLIIIAALIITFFINWQLTIILIAAIIIYAVILWKSVPGLAGLQKKMHQAYNTAYGKAFDSLENIREIKQATTELREQNKIRNNFISRAAKFWVNMNSIFQRLNFFQKMIVTLTQLSIFIISFFLVRNGTLTPGELVAFNGYSAMILGPFVILGQNWETLQNGLVAIVRAEKILKFPTENYVPKNAVSPTRIKGDIVFENVHFSYKNGEPILKGTSFHVHPGEKVAFVGESGVGKTTITDLISGFYFPQKGKILIDGIDTRRMNLTQYRSLIAVASQEPVLFNDTIETNILYGNKRKSKREMIDAARKAHAHEFIESFPNKYKQIVGWRGIKLSVGQKQRIALARAFLKNPDILILDEPTSALDAKSEHLIKSSLKKLMENRTTLIIAHRLSTVREVDTILVLKDGLICEKGSHKDLIKIKNGVYRSLYELQSGFFD